MTNEPHIGPCQRCGDIGPLQLVCGRWLCEPHAEWQATFEKFRLMVDAMAGAASDMDKLETQIRKRHQSQPEA